MYKHLSRVAPVVAGVLAGLLISAPFVAGRELSVEAQSCGASKNSVKAEFSLSEARQVWQYFPAMLRAPELEEDSAPATVVVFSGDFDQGAVAMGGRGERVGLLSEVLCVVQSDGTVNLYYDVSRKGSKY